MNKIWIAYYTDGTLLSEVDKEGNEFKFKHIRQEKLEKFDLVIGTSRFSINVDKGELNLNGTKLSFPESKLGRHRLIYFHRVRQTIGTVSGMSKVEADVYFGFQTNVEGTNVKRLFYLKPNGLLIQE